jgi:hypothetical protein
VTATASRVAAKFNSIERAVAPLGVQLIQRSSWISSVLLLLYPNGAIVGCACDKYSASGFTPYYRSQLRGCPCHWATA